MIDALFTANPSDHHPVGALLVGFLALVSISIYLLLRYLYWGEQWVLKKTYH
jgi:hypothetical protein